MKNLPEYLQNFIKNETWIFAKTYAKTWPHEYIVEEQVDNLLFNEFAKYIDQFGHEEKFYDNDIIYLHYENHAYWHMENIINRCLLNNTFKQRKLDDMLPNDI